MRKALFRGALSLGAVTLLCACVTVPEFQSLRSDVDKLKQSKGSASSTDDWGGGKPGSSGNRLADLGAQVDGLQAEIAQLRGELESLRKQVNQGQAAAPSSLGGAGAAPIAGAAAGVAGAAGATGEVGA
ncbi:MAG: hypothetical protein ACREJT_06085, partial [Myxococcota bacterium]